MELSVTAAALLELADNAGNSTWPTTRCSARVPEECVLEEVDFQWKAMEFHNGQSLGLSQPS